MPNVVRFGCAGAVLILIAALTSVGLYAMVVGGVPWANAVTRTASGAAPVMVTIQAAPLTPTLVPTSTPVAGAAPALLRSGSTTAATGAPAAPLAPPAPAPTPAEPRAVETRTVETRGAGDGRAPAATPTAPSAPGATSAGAPSSGAALPPASASTRPGLGIAASASARDSSLKASHDGVVLEVMEIERTWQPADSDSAASRRRDTSDLLTVHVRLTNQTGELRYVADSDVLLVTEDGARLAPRQSAPQREPHLVTVPASANDSVRGWLTYDVPTGVEPRRLQWSPTRPDRPRADATYLLTLPR